MTGRISIRIHGILHVTEEKSNDIGDVSTGFVTEINQRSNKLAVRYS